MALSDEEKALIKDEIATLTEEQEDALHSLKEAGLELKAQVADHLLGITKTALELKAQAAEQSAAHEKIKTQAAEQVTAHEKLIHELKIYRTVIRWVIGSSVVGILAGFAYLRPFIDRSIENRLLKTYELNIGIAQANSGSWHDALPNFDKIYDEIKSGKVDASRQFRDFLYGDMIWIMAQDDFASSEDTWGGENDWMELWKDNDFYRNYITGQWLRAYDSDNHNLAVCVLKFDRGDDALKKAQYYYQSAIAASDLPVKKSPRLFGLAMIDLINGDQDAALGKLREAGMLDPANYTLTEFAKNKWSYKNSNDFRIYNVAARRRSIDFGQRLDALVDRINAEANPGKPENR
jgi:hypothetical protein